MKNKIILVILILSMIVLVFSGCGGGNLIIPPPPDSEPLETIIPDTTKVVEEETIQAITSVAEDQSTIIFKTFTPQLEELIPGDIIAMGVTEHTPEGLLRRVKKITKGGKNGNEIIVETEFATLEEAIEQGEFYFNEALKAEDAKEPTYYVEGIEFIRDKSKIKDSKIQLLEFNFKIDAIIFDGDNNPETKEDNITLTGQIAFNYNLLFSGKIGFPHLLKELNFQNIVKIEKNLGVTVGGPVKLFSKKIDLYTHDCGIKVVWIGCCFPVVLHPKITISANVEGEIFAKATVEITDEDTYTAGIKFDNGNWQPISSHENNFSPPSLSFSTGGSITFGVGPKLECKVDGVLGPYCKTTLYGKAIADIFTDPWWKLYLGIIAEAGVKIEIFSKVFASANLTVLDFEKIIAQADGPFINLNHAPIISDLTANPSSIDINQTTTIICTASDEDGDILTYTWTKTGGTFEGSTTGPTITWRAPSTPDTYTVECEVSDGDESDSKSVNIEVTFIAGSQYVIQWSTAESNGWANPLGEGKELITSTAYDYNSDIYLNNWGKKHTGTDIIGELDGNVYSIASGTVMKITRDYSSASNQSVVITKHTNSNNEDFFAIYGHVLARSDLEVNSELEVGEKIGIIKKAGSPIHLHFGINLSSEITDFIFTNSDGQWGWGRIPAFANPSDYGWVDPIDYLNAYLPLSSLTPEEIELIRKWGFGGDYIVRRWPDGYVDVYDETSYIRIQDILNEWNTAIGGSIIFHLSNDPNSPVKVKFDPDLSQDLAGQYLVYCSDDDYEFYRADVNIQKIYLDSLDSDTKYCLYLYLFSGVAGFNIQADVDPYPFEEWQNFDKIPDIIKTMLRGLYKVPCGYNLSDKKLKKNWDWPIVKNLQNIYEGGLYKLCK